MPGKINVYNLGALGVNRVRQPLQAVDGELLSAQNATVRQVGARLAISKRDGLAKMNDTTASGSILAIANLPFVDPDPMARVFAGLTDQFSTTWSVSVNGTTWNDVSTPSTRPVSTAKRGPANPVQTPCRSITDFHDKAWFPGDNYTQSTDSPYICTFDGTTVTTVATIPRDASNTVAYFVSDMLAVPELDLIFIGVRDQGSSVNGANIFQHGRVFKLDPNTLALTQIGAEFGRVGGVQSGFPGTLAFFDSKLWAGGWNNFLSQTGRLSYFEPMVGTAWTTETTLGGDPRALYVWKNKLFIGMNQDGIELPAIYTRDAAGVYTSKLTRAGALDSQAMFANFIEFNGYLYTHYSSLTATVESKILRSYDGDNWEVDYDIIATLGDAVNTCRPGAAYLRAGNLLLTVTDQIGVTGRVLRRTAAGVWTSVVQSNISGHLLGV